MQRKINILLLFLSFILLGFGQKQNNIWHFGYGASIDFNSGIAVSTSNSAISAFEGSASICDTSGALLFYTDGMTVFNRNHIQMPNGFGLNGHASDTQPATIVRKPGSTNLYYIFTCGGVGFLRQAHYSIVDMNANAGLGNVIQKNILFANNVAEAMLVIPHAQQNNYWIVFNVIDTNQIQAHLLDCNGVNPNPVISNAGLKMQYGLYVSNLVVSSDYTKIAATGTYLTDVAIMNFDNNTGILSDNTFIRNIDFAFGARFSPNSQQLYLTHSIENPSTFPSTFSNEILQYNVSSNDSTSIQASKTILDTIQNTGNGDFGQMQLAPDGKIYISRNGATSLPVINNPDGVGIASNYTRNGFTLLTGMSSIGLPEIAYVSDIPTHIPLLGNDTVLCSNSLLLQSINTEQNTSWNTGETTSNITVNQTGIYTIQTQICGAQYKDSISVQLDSPFNFTIAIDTIFCTSALLSANYTDTSANYLWSNGLTSSSIYGTNFNTYSLLISKGTCSYSDTLSINFSEEALVVPNIFTPNSDSKNDLFEIVTDCQQVKQAYIYNRWGNLVKQTENTNKIWDGTTEGNIASDGLYYLVLSYTNTSGDLKEYKGTITLER